MELSTSSVLQGLTAYGTLEEIEAAIKKAMKEKEMREFAIEKFGCEPKHEFKKKGENFQEQFRYSFRLDGKQKSITGTTKEIVYKKVWDYFHTGNTIVNKNATLEQVFEEYFVVRQGDQSKSTETFRNERIDWNRFLANSKLAKMPIRSITVSDLKEYFGELTGRGNLKKKAARKPLTILNAVFDYATPAYCEHNIAREINLNNFHFSMESAVDVFSDEEETTLLEYIRSLPQTVYTLAIRLDFCFNVRIGELRALTWDDYDEKEGSIKVWHQVVLDKVDGRRTTVDIPYTKGNRESGIRVLPVSEEAKEILAELRKINGGCHYILQSKGKLPITTKHFNSHLRAFCAKCGINYHSSHKVRYLGITKLYEAGVDEVVIQRTAGHSTVDMTRHYNRDRRALHIDRDQWEKLFGKKA